MPRDEPLFENAAAALLAVASESERLAYQEELARGPQKDQYGEETRDTTVANCLLPRLIEKLKEGEIIASGFGYESGQPTELHPRLWQRLTINVQANSAYDAWANVSHKSATGSFHSLGFRVVRRSDAAGRNSVKDEMVETIRTLFESLDATLPLNAGKKRFFHEASETLGRTIPNAWLNSAWKSANIPDVRRRPGLKTA